MAPPRARRGHCDRGSEGCCAASAGLGVALCCLVWARSSSDSFCLGGVPSLRALARSRAPKVSCRVQPRWRYQWRVPEDLLTEWPQWPRKEPVATRPEGSFIVHRGWRYALPYDCPTYKDFSPGAFRHASEENRFVARMFEGFRQVKPPHGFEKWDDVIAAGHMQWRSAPDMQFEAVLPAQIVQRGDEFRVSHHVHEPCIAAFLQPGLIYESRDFLVLDKPGGMAMCLDGKGFNSLQGYAEMYAPLVEPVHLLEGPMSGVVVYSKNPKTDRLLEDELKGGSVVYTFVARVIGDVPPDTDLLINTPIDGCPATTRVRFLKRLKAVDGDAPAESLVEVVPVERRSSSMRKHLQEVGWPIVDDSQNGGRERPPTLIFDDMPNGPLAKAFRRCARKGCTECEKAQGYFTGKLEKPCIRPGAISLHCTEIALQKLGLSFKSPTPAWAEEGSEAVLGFDLPDDPAPQEPGFIRRMLRGVRRLLR